LLAEFYFELSLIYKVQMNSYLSKRYFKIAIAYHPQSIKKYIYLSYSHFREKFRIIYYKYRRAFRDLIRCLLEFVGVLNSREK
jgi:hypothetical protein